MDNIPAVADLSKAFHEGDVPASGYWIHTVPLEGRKWWVEDKGPRTEAGMMNVPRQPGGRRVCYVRNAGATTLAAGDVVKWSSGYRGRRVEKNDTDKGEVAGVVIDLLGSAGCIQYDLCAIVTKGPNLCTKPADSSTNWAEGLLLMADNVGKVQDAGVASLSTDAVAGANAILNGIGKVRTSPTNAATTVLTEVAIFGE